MRGAAVLHDMRAWSASRAVTPPPGTPASLPRRVVAVVNPVHHDHGAAVDAVQRALAVLGLNPATVVETTPSEPGRTQAARAAASGADLVVAVGGDGTVREVALGLAHTGVDMGVVPSGTANLFALNIGLRGLSLQQAAQVAVSGRRAVLDLGRAQWQHADDTSGEAVFLVLAGLGNDALTVARVSPRLKRRIGWLAYLAPAARTLFQPRQPVELTLDGVPEAPLPTWSVLALNADRLPFGMRMAPATRLDDGRLDLLVAAPGSVRQWVDIAVAGLRASAADVPGLTRRPVVRASVRSRTPQAVQLDGDVVLDVSSLDVWADAAALRLRVPPAGVRAAGR